MCRMWTVGALALFVAWGTLASAGFSHAQTGSPHVVDVEMRETMWAAKRSNLRSGPATRYDKVGLLGVGEEVMVTGKVGKWFRIERAAAEGGVAFVYGPLLTDTRPVANTPPEPDKAFGTVNFAHGRYEGWLKNGKPHGRGKYIAHDGARYEGDFVQGKVHGHGTLSWVNGDRYDGDFVNGDRTGRGTFTWADGDRYDGDFVNGDRTGRGTFTWASGNRYDGDFMKGHRTGRGTFTWANGEFFEGYFAAGQRHGRGTYTWASGERYRGEWREGKRQEGGTWTEVPSMASSRKRSDAQWKSGGRKGDTCLTVERIAVGAFWFNRCDVLVDVTWRDEKYCSSTSNNKYPCSWHVGPNARATASISGTVWWHECKSPGGLGEVLAIETSYGRVACKGNPTSQDFDRVVRGRESRMVILAREEYRKQRQERLARQQREQWEREAEERLEEERWARQRRDREMWEQIGKTVGEGIGNYIKQKRQLEELRRGRGGPVGAGVRDCRPRELACARLDDVKCRSRPVCPE